MRFDKEKQWIGAVYAEDLVLMAEMLAEDPSLANFSHEAFDDPYREGRFPVYTLSFAVCRSTATADRLAPGGTQDRLRHGEAARRSGRRPQYRKRTWPAPLSLSGRTHGAVPDRAWRRHQSVARQRGRAGVFRGVADRSLNRLKMLIQLGADPGQINPHNGSSAFHSAAEVRPGDELVADHLENIHILKEAGLDPNHRAGVGVQSDWGPVYQGDAPLHMAAQLNRPEVIEALIAAGCNRSQANVAHETPREVALRVGRERGRRPSALGWRGDVPPAETHPASSTPIRVS